MNEKTKGSHDEQCEKCKLWFPKKALFDFEEKNWFCSGCHPGPLGYSAATDAYEIWNSRKPKIPEVECRQCFRKMHTTADGFCSETCREHFGHDPVLTPGQVAALTKPDFSSAEQFERMNEENINLRAEVRRLSEAFGVWAPTGNESFADAVRRMVRLLDEMDQFEDFLGDAIVSLETEEIQAAWHRQFDCVADYPSMIESLGSIACGWAFVEGLRQGRDPT